MWALLALLAACFLSLAIQTFADEAIEIRLRHNLGDGFVDAGVISGTILDELQHKTPLRIDWTVPETAKDALKDLASKDGMYRLAIDSRSGTKLHGDVMISVPARCFEASLHTLHRLDMHATLRGGLMAIQWRFERSLDCSPEARKDLAAWPATSKASVLLPVAGPDISDLASSLIDERYSEKLGQAYADIASGGKEGSKEAQAKRSQKEKTFLEKNWMFILAGAMLLFNVVATKPPPTAQQGRPAR